MRASINKKLIVKIDTLTPSEVALKICLHGLEVAVTTYQIYLTSTHSTRITSYFHSLYQYY